MRFKSWLIGVLVFVDVFMFANLVAQQKTLYCLQGAIHGHGTSNEQI
jgi:hypothetical protein